MMSYDMCQQTQDNVDTLANIFGVWGRLEQRCGLICCLVFGLNFARFDINLTGLFLKEIMKALPDQDSHLYVGLK